MCFAHGDHAYTAAPFVYRNADLSHTTVLKRGLTSLQGHVQGGSHHVAMF
jgi:hypothetical protein